MQKESSPFDSVCDVAGESGARDDVFSNTSLVCTSHRSRIRTNAAAMCLSMVYDKQPQPLEI
jgi:hypothetical protein